MNKLMISVSGIRGIVGDGLTPEVVTNYAAAFGTFTGQGRVVIGRDSRVSGEMVMAAALAGLEAVGCDVIDVGICPTPTIQLAVENLKAVGGIAVTASHNPIQWNALKLIAKQGLFLDEREGKKVQEIAGSKDFEFATWDKVGHRTTYLRAVADHINAILDLKYINTHALRKRKFKVAVDCVNGAGSTLIPELLDKLGCQIVPLNCEPTGLFPRIPEPLPENLVELCRLVKKEEVDVGFAVDPDADRLAIVSERGIPLGEEYTLALAVKFLLGKRRGTVVVNASTTKAIEDVAAEYGSTVERTKVGEIHVAKKMQQIKATIGGEGNGGVILPDIHLGRDAPVAIALTLQHLLEWGESLSELYLSLPQYVMAKRKIELANADLDAMMAEVEKRYSQENCDFTDGIKILWRDSWVHLRKSNTEPVIRIIAEARSKEKADQICHKFIEELTEIAR